MFNLGKEKDQGKAPEWEFDLEKDVSDAAAKKKLKAHIEQRVAELKTLLRQGEDKQTFDKAQTLLHGFLAAEKVVGRIGQKF